MVVRRDDVVGSHAEGTQQNSCVELAATVDANVQDILNVKLEVDPGATVRDDSRRVEQLS